jgi:acyl dehydratase
VTAPKLHFEDFAPGQIREFGPRVITREEIVAFAAEFDPQPMHLDEEAARHTMLGGLAASGWHSCGLMMRMMCDGFLLNSSSMGANAIEEVCWLKPVRPGDRLTLRATVLDARTSKSRPDLGFIGTLMELYNQSGECVMTLKAALMMGRRAGATA